MTRYLSPDEAAAEILGWIGAHRGQKLLRLVLRRERIEHREIAIRGPGKGNGTRYLLTEATLRLHFPELFAPQIDALTLALTQKVDELRATIGATVDERMAPQMQQLRANHRALAVEVTRLAESTNEGFTRAERRIQEIENRLDNKSSQVVTCKL